MHDPNKGCPNWILDQLDGIAELAPLREADMVIGSNYGSQWRYLRGKPYILHTCEPWDRMDERHEQAAHILGYDPDGEACTRLPSWIMYLDPRRDYSAPGTVTADEVTRRRNKILAVVSDKWCPPRNMIMTAALDRGMMDSMGGWMPTHPQVRSKHAVCEMYAFVLAAENGNAQPGYTTEKIIDAINAGAIPVYWGAEQTDINPARVIDRADYESDAAMLDHIAELSRDTEAMAAIINQPVFLPGKDPRPHIRERVRELVVGLFSGRDIFDPTII